MSTFVIPTPFRAWCHLCNAGFMSLDDLMKHEKESLNIHQKLNQKALEELNAKKGK